MNKVRTVLFLTPRFYPQIGGVETHVLKVSKELVKQGYRVIIIAEALESGFKDQWQNRYISDNAAGFEYIVDKSIESNNNKSINTSLINFLTHEEDSDLYKENIHLYRLPVVKQGRIKKFYIWKWLLKNRKIIQKADIVHCHDVFYWYLPFRFIFYKKPVYVTFHGYEKYPIPRNNILIRKISEKLAWGNICIGEFIEKWYGTKANYISYGAADNNYKNQKSKAGNTKKNLNLLFLGRLEKDLGLDIYLKALLMLKNKGIIYDFFACGDGSMREEVARVGRVTGMIENLEEYINNADIVFASSYLSILQALAMQKNVIAVFDNPLKEDYLKMTPFSKWINIVNTPSSVFNKIEHIINKTQMENHLILDSQKWIKLQTWKNLTVNYLELWGLV